MALVDACLCHITSTLLITTHDLTCFSFQSQCKRMWDLRFSLSTYLHILLAVFAPMLTTDHNYKSNFSSLATMLTHWIHWSIQARITYKLCLLKYRVVHRTAPVYLPELCQPCTDPRRRSTARGDFQIPRTNRHFTNSSFSIAAPMEQTTYTHSYLYNSVIVSIQTQDSPAHYIICCPLGLVTVRRPRALVVGRSRKCDFDWLTVVLAPEAEFGLNNRIRTNTLKTIVKVFHHVSRMNVA